MLVVSSIGIIREIAKRAVGDVIKVQGDSHLLEIILARRPRSERFKHLE